MRCSHIVFATCIPCNWIQPSTEAGLHTFSLCARLQGPYDVMLQGCDSVQGGTTLRTLVTDVNLPNFTFSQRLPEVLAVTSTSYLWHAVSVQTSSGTILGCGRLETLFPVEGSYRGKNTLSQFTQYLPPTVSDVSNIELLKYNILDGISGTCSNTSTIFDPWSPPGPQYGDTMTSDQVPVGDLPNHVLEVFSILPEVPLIGSATILGHVVSHGLHIAHACTTHVNAHFLVPKLMLSVHTIYSHHDIMPFTGSTYSICNSIYV